MRILLATVSAAMLFCPTETKAQSLGDFIGALGQNSRRPSAYQAPPRFPQSPSLPNSERAVLSGAQRNFDPSQNLLPNKDCRVQDEFIGALRRGMAEELVDPTVDHPVAYFGVPLSQWTAQHVVEADHFMENCRGSGQVQPGFFANDLWPAIVAARPEVDARQSALAADAAQFNSAMERVSVGREAERALAASDDPQGVRQCLIGNLAADLRNSETALVSNVDQVQMRTRDQYGQAQRRSSYRATGKITPSGQPERPFSLECSAYPGLGWAVSG